MLNLTPHLIRVMTPETGEVVEVPPSGTVARVSTTEQVVETRATVPEGGTSTTSPVSGFMTRMRCGVRFSMWFCSYLLVNHSKTLKVKSNFSRLLSGLPSHSVVAGFAFSYTYRPIPKPPTRVKRHRLGAPAPLGASVRTPMCGYSATPHGSGKYSWPCFTLSSSRQSVILANLAQPQGFAPASADQQRYFMVNDVTPRRPRPSSGHLPSSHLRACHE